MTTVRQPLQKMGSIAADMLLRKLAGEALPARTLVEPELMVRESTAPARQPASRAGR